MKNVITVFVTACLLCGILASCAANKTIVVPGSDTVANNTALPKESTRDDTQGSEDVDTSKYSLEDIDGWWYHIGQAVSGTIPVVEVFSIDAASGTWTEYSTYGAAGGTYTCSVSGDEVSLDYGEKGVTSFTYDGISLLNSSGFIEYIPGEPIEKVDVSMYDGKWYRSGNTDSDYYEINADSYVLYSDGNANENGTWVSEDAERTLDDGTAVEELQLKLSSTEKTETYIVADKGTVLYDIENCEAYVHEKVIGTDVGDTLIRKYDLICHEWEGPDSDFPTIVFGYYGNHFYLVNNVDFGNDNIEVIKEIGGTWGIDGYELCLHYGDGHEEITPYDPETIVFSYYSGMSFTKVQK